MFNRSMHDLGFRHQYMYEIEFINLDHIYKTNLHYVFYVYNL